jgi:hypothetical protein
MAHLHSSARTFPILAVSLVAAFLILSGMAIDFSRPPFEDAAMLMRYADHFAHNQGIVWNVGEEPVDGATDFLFMIFVGLLVKAGASLEHATRMSGGIAHLLTVIAVYWTLASNKVADVAMASVSAIYVAVGPGLYYVAAYFGTPCFAFFGCVTWICALAIMRNGITQLRAGSFAVCALITCLIRPEGVILTALMLGSLLCVVRSKQAVTIACYYLVAVGVIGGAYFAWRWQYFGHPLPNPFYKKGGGRFYVDSFFASWKNVVALGLPFLPAFLVGAHSPSTRRHALALSIPIAGFASSFVLLSNEMNFGRRFQYAVLPLMAISWWPLLATARAGIDEALGYVSGRGKLWLQLIAIVAAGTGAVIYQRIINHPVAGRDGRYEAALMLKNYQDDSLTIATSEAGLLPLYSAWRAIDTWGLNDSWIAHHGGITLEYLERNKPDVIMFHAPFVPNEVRTTRDDWTDMIKTLETYAREHRYVLAAAYTAGSSDAHYYYVRRECRKAAEITHDLGGIDYWIRGGKAENRALLLQ